MMNAFSVNSLLEDLEKIKGYAAMADLSQENISRLLSKQLRSLPLKRGDKNGGGHLRWGVQGCPA